MDRSILIRASYFSSLEPKFDTRLTQLVNQMLRWYLRDAARSENLGGGARSKGGAKICLPASGIPLKKFGEFSNDSVFSLPER